MVAPFTGARSIRGYGAVSIQRCARSSIAAKAAARSASVAAFSPQTKPQTEPLSKPLSKPINVSLGPEGAASQDAGAYSSGTGEGSNRVGRLDVLPEEGQPVEPLSWRGGRMGGLWLVWRPPRIGGGAGESPVG